VTRALEELIKRERLTELKQYQGKIDLNIDLDVLRGPCVTFLSIRPSGSAISEVAKVLVVWTPLIEARRVVTNDLILTELLPFL